MLLEAMKKAPTGAYGDDIETFTGACLRSQLRTVVDLEAFRSLIVERSKFCVLLLKKVDI